MSGADLRGFRYALEPLLRRQRWELERLQARLGEVQREIELAREALQAQTEALEAQSARAAAAMVARVDPQAHRQSLHWLARLREKITEAEEALEQLREKRARLLAEHAQCSHRLEVIEKHREDSVALFTTEQGRQEAAAADRDWLARRAANRPAGEEGAAA